MSEEAKQQGQINSGAGRNINTNGGMYNESSTINNSGGVNVFGGKVEGGVHYTHNRLSAGDEKKLQELFAALYQEIQATPASTSQEQKDKASAEKASEGLKQEIEEVKKDPKHKPDEFRMNGFVAAFKKLGAPVFNAAMTLIGLPVLGQAVNQFAQALPEGDEKK